MKRVIDSNNGPYSTNNQYFQNSQQTNENAGNKQKLDGIFKEIVEDKKQIVEDNMDLESTKPQETKKPGKTTIKMSDIKSMHDGLITIKSYFKFDK